MIGLGVVAAALALMLRQYKPEFGLLVSLCCGVVLLLAVLAGLDQVIQSAQEMAAQAQLPQEYVGVLFKALGLCVITQLAGDTCRDAGEGAIASRVELAGKVAVLLTGLPLFQKLLEIALSLVNL